ncbi:hypothetical protein LJK87_35350 [Paenibacillus sp. P25]|nr:hypothetical protein LJK87_35350 [Paenibacillus sp. P25]
MTLPSQGAETDLTDAEVLTDGHRLFYIVCKCTLHAIAPGRPAAAQRRGSKRRLPAVPNAAEAVRPLVPPV